MPIGNMDDMDITKELWYIDALKKKKQREEEGIIVPDVKFISRAEWGALPPEEPGELQELPVDTIILNFNTDYLEVEDTNICKKAIRKMQKRHMEKGETDIIYNFIVCGDGNIYEGRGWKIMHTPFFSFPEDWGETIVVGVFGDTALAHEEHWNAPDGLCDPIGKLIYDGHEQGFLRNPKEVYVDIDNHF